MNHDEFAFFNHQLAAMLRDGIPLEGALKELSAGMKDHGLRDEIQKLENDLSSGAPLAQAITHRRLPPLYVRMLQIGARSQDMPGILTLLADHYQRAGTVWNRLKGLMVYPLIVILVSLGLTIVLSIVFSRFVTDFVGEWASSGSLSPGAALGMMWISPLVLAVAAALCIGVFLVPSWRASMRWRLPAFRDASLAHLASSLSLMLRNGVPLPEALALAESMESQSPARHALGHWRRLVESGEGSPSRWQGSMPPFPSLFLWLVRRGGEDLAGGFDKAAEIYRTRASYRIDLALYGALPVSVLLLGQMIFWQVAPLLKIFADMMKALGGN